MPTPIDLVVPKAGAHQEATLEAYRNIGALNTIIETALTQRQGVLPGGTLKVASASAGSISLVETFRRPVVIGYVGFDAAIGIAGVLGPPVPTYAVLEGTIGPPAAPTSTSQLFSNAALHFTYKTLDELKMNGDEEAGGLVERLDKAAAGLLPNAYPCNVWKLAGPTGPLKMEHKAGDSMGKRTFRQITVFRGKLVESIRAIEYVQQNPSVSIEPKPQETAQIKDDLKANRDELKAINEGLRRYSDTIRLALEYAIVPPQVER